MALTFINLVKTFMNPFIFLACTSFAVMSSLRLLFSVWSQVSLYLSLVHVTQVVRGLTLSGLKWTSQWPLVCSHYTQVPNITWNRMSCFCCGETDIVFKDPDSVSSTVFSAHFLVMPNRFQGSFRIFSFWSSWFTFSCWRQRWAGHVAAGGKFCF